MINPTWLIRLSTWFVLLFRPTLGRDSKLCYAGVLLFSFYKTAVFPLAN